MKYLCERCERLVEVGRFWSEGAALAFACSRCGAETRVAPAPEAAGEAPAAAAAAVAAAAAPAPAPSSPSAHRLVALRPVPAPSPEEDPFAVPEGHCPKCVARRREDALSCTQCGLVFSNSAAPEHLPTPELLAALRELTARWEDSGAHERMVAGALARGELALAGRFYRLRLARQPQDPFAQRGRDEVLRLASTAGALASPRQEEGTRSRVPVIAAALLLAAALVMAVVLTVRQMSSMGPLP